uniref:hypothetical protein n=1 Tax=Hemiaulus sinensis TaxID=1003062 RepID=UPI0020296D3F|nr:hypothetical protein NDB36_mgp27 [Hemiaulus sinensis]QYB23186.1 hypothetical protein [Hemiaulus sinensis]
MKLKFKNFNENKIINFFKNKPFFFIYQNTTTNCVKWTKTEQKFSKLKLNSNKFQNNLMVLFLNKSIFKNLTPIINGSIILLDLKQENKVDLSANQLENLDNLFFFLSLKLNNKLYSKSQIKNLSTLNYKQNVKIFSNSLKNILKKTNYKLIK